MSKARYIKCLVEYKFVGLHAGTIASSALVFLNAILVSSGCTLVRPDYVKPTAPEPGQWLESDDPKIESKEVDFSNWWTVFNDPGLNDLIQAAYQQNLTLQIAG